MDIKVQLNNIRVSPRKARRVIDLIRGKKTLEARSILAFTTNKSSQSVLKLLNSALASAKNDFKLNELDFFVSKITVDEGPKLKRMFPMSRGRAYPIMKRTSRIALTISEMKSKTEEKNKEKNPSLPKLSEGKRKTKTKKTK